ncbi:signal peptidase I [Flavivirga rizhaonensis]|nr:signal peptidase I [Flavivirga rizhaonensis]
MLFTIIYFGVLKVITSIKSPLIKRLLKVFFIFLLTFSISISAKILIFDFFLIPSTSMEDTLFTQDVILVNKLKYGPRLPRSPFDIPWLNIVFYFNENAKKRIKKGNWWDYKRLSGTTAIKQGDVFVFNSTWKKQFIMVKRCVALSGDTLYINDGEIFTNDNQFVEPNTVKNKYRFNVKNKMALYKALDSLALNDIVLKNIGGEINEAILSEFELNQLKKYEFVSSVSKQIDTFISNKTFVKLPDKKWTFDNMGPIIIPEKGMQIPLNTETFELYKSAINSSEGFKIKEIDGVYYIDGKEVNNYTFKQDYYFMVGDNRKRTMDSRAWGFVPASNIIGKVQCVLFSNYQDRFRWDRLLKSID